MSSFRTVTDTILTDTIGERTTSSGVTVENNLIAENDMIVENNFYLTALSQNNDNNGLRELLIDTSNNRVVTRSYNIDDYQSITESFHYSSITWAIVPAPTIGVPVLDQIINSLSTPTTIDTVGSILSTYPWRIRSNNLDDLYCLNADTSGLYVYIHDDQPLKHFAISRPFCANISTGAMSYQIRVAINNLTITNSYFFGIVNGDCIFDLDGNNYNIIDEAIGFSIAYGTSSNYNIHLERTIGGTSTKYDTGVVCNEGDVMTLGIEWGVGNINPLYTYNNGTTSGQNNTFNTTATVVDYSPVVLAINPANSACQLFLKRIKMSAYTIV